VTDKGGGGKNYKPSRGSITRRSKEVRPLSGKGTTMWESGFIPHPKKSESLGERPKWGFRKKEKTRGGGGGGGLKTEHFRADFTASVKEWGRNRGKKSQPHDPMGQVEHSQ